jgi:hypothetical protein
MNEPTIHSEVLKLCDAMAAAGPRDRDTIPAPANDDVDELPKSSVRASDKTRAAEKVYDTIPAPPPSSKDEEEAEPSTIPSTRLPNVAEA